MGSKSLWLFLILELILNIVCGQRYITFFRKDYDYLNTTDSFYKYHTEFKTWMEARTICSREGAKLYFSESQTETDAVTAHMKETGHDYNHVFYGVSDLLVEGIYETVDGRPLIDVYATWGNGEPNNSNDEEDCTVIRRDGTINDDKCTKTYNFICKKTLASLDWNDNCDIPYAGYFYNEDTGNCYKFHSTPLNWTEAYGVCVTEQSYLAVINTPSEADRLVKMTADAPKNKQGDYVRDAVHLGFRNPLDEGWITVKGKSLEESGYSKWAEKQPDGGDNEKCGSMFHDGRLNDIGCEKRAFFICEHEVRVKATSLIDFRYENDDAEK